MSPVMLVHICGGSLGLISGAAALSFRKGSRRHALAGKIFVASMLTMAAGAVYLAILKHQPGNFGGGIFTFYLIWTAWLTARRRDGQINPLDWLAVLIPLILGILTWMSGIEKLRNPAPPSDGVPGGMNLFMGSVMLLAALGDIRMLAGAGVLGVRRIPRHLWRMCFGLFIATGSFFLGPNNRPLRLLGSLGLRQHFFSVVLRQELLLFLAVLPLLLLVFWLLRVRLKRGFRNMPAVIFASAGSSGKPAQG
jgi:uncharacterized membrane protein